MKGHKKLGEFASTAISGNDISSSVLYVSALAIAFAGQYAWITLLFVVGVLYLFRKIYGEVVGAIPMNGGAYNALLNTTSKAVASVAATLTILSYMATAVISSNEAMHYLHHIIPSLPVIPATIVVLLAFAILTVNGITESAIAAIVIFVFHLVSLTILTAFIIFNLFHTGLDVLIANQSEKLSMGNIGRALLFGFAVSMLGVSGFESSANFVEEQKKGVFPKTLKNMWMIVSVVNPLMAIFALSLFSVSTIQTETFQTTLLVIMGEKVGGNWLAGLVSIDAVLVLSGAVLTSFVGVTGLLERLTLDRVLPNYFLKKNKKGSSYRIVIMFLLLCVSVLLITRGRVSLLAGVYAISFLSVMVLFGVGNILLKRKRAKLPRPEVAKWSAVVVAILAVSIALYGNIIIIPQPGQPSNFSVFLYYAIPFLLFIWAMLNRTLLLKVLLSVIQSGFKTIRHRFNKINHSLFDSLHKINKQRFVFFTKGDSMSKLNRVMQYIEDNEHTKYLRIVAVLDEGQSLPIDFKKEITFLDKLYNDIKIELFVLDGKFTPAFVQNLSEEWNIPVNFMFIGSPTNKFPYRLEEFGGVRMII